MTPRGLRPAVVHDRLAEMRLLLDDLDRLPARTGDDLRVDRFLRHVVERVLTQLVETAVAVNGHVGAAILDVAVTDYRSSFDTAARAGAITSDLAVRLKASVGLRNVVVHAYLDVDLEVVAEAIPLARKGYGEYVDQLAGWLAAR